MKWPFVPRSTHELALQQIEDLKDANAQLLEALRAKTAVMAELEKEPAIAEAEPRTTRKRGGEIREMANKAAREGKLGQIKLLGPKR